MRAKTEWTLQSGVIVFGLLLSGLAMAAPPTEAETVAQRIAEYMVRARAVIANNQSLFNNSGKADKGFSAAVYEVEIADGFNRMTGMDVTKLTDNGRVSATILKLHQSAKEIVTEAQPQINTPGQGFKSFSPAIFGKRTLDRFGEKTGLKAKQTSIKNRNPANKPDEFERQILEKFATGWRKQQPYTEATVVDSKKVVRHMLPLYITATCLPCHGDPAGERDISGNIKEGYKEGELRGAISVIVPVDE